MEETDPSVEVTVTEQDTEHAAIRLVGELTESARRPLVRVMTDLLLGAPQLRRVQLDTCAVGFMNSAGMSALVQVQKMCQPRGIDLTLVVHGSAVSRPLQLSGLWHRFTVIDRRDDAPPVVHEATHERTEHS
ncbi:STAS domain-containing protein [Modestobacter versicolor]|uniref:Anti-anti-sigma factor n=1 Tax=Modestobacter versicolor TaxID=429133 RepID=A0A323VBA3_9ACTN|nr:STAS domain-containing protein [Modestobacter versicolor]MBB3677240.1 anti-anti-sigma factor [Modestobacter versicolor]PZA20496.1 anti-sigma factor antagonist [Modestobacter versicolor]